MRYLLLFGLLSLVTGIPRALAQADPCALVLSGRVIDDHDREPLAFAELYLPEPGRHAMADSAGRFAITGLCAGTYRVRAAHLGCEPVERTVTLRADMEIDIRLEHHAQELREAEIVRNRPDEHVGQANAQVDKAAMERGSGRTLGEMIAVIPGVTALNSGPTISKPMVHGLAGNRVLVLNQGIRQEDQQWGGEHAPSARTCSSDGYTPMPLSSDEQVRADDSCCLVPSDEQVRADDTRRNDQPTL